MCPARILRLGAACSRRDPMDVQRNTEQSEGGSHRAWTEKEKPAPVTVRGKNGAPYPIK